jgi:hypothetical protein
MSAAEGHVTGTTQVVDHGPSSLRWNIVVLGDGYRDVEMPRYHSDVQDLINRLSSTPPFTELWRGTNVFRVDVVSLDSGADDPAGCPDEHGSGATARTYFDATFCGGSGLFRRVLTVDYAWANAVAKAQVPAKHLALVLVNAPQVYGGSGWPPLHVAVASTHPLSATIAIHEIGHAICNLADEYEAAGGVVPAGEPVEPNATRNPQATGKWDDLIAPGTPLPTSCYSDCPGCIPPAVPPAPGTVGTYEGAMYSHCGLYRPTEHCYMRDYSAFCPVYSRVIRQTLAVYMP